MNLKSLFVFMHLFGMHAIQGQKESYAKLVVCLLTCSLLKLYTCLCSWVVSCLLQFLAVRSLLTWSSLENEKPFNFGTFILASGMKLSLIFLFILLAIVVALKVAPTSGNGSSGEFLVYFVAKLSYLISSSS